MGAGEPLAPEILSVLPERLIEMPTAFSIVVCVDEGPAALANCFFGFSTFAAQKLVNIHDVVVLSHFRGQGLSRKLFDEIEKIANENDCCKLTLEVLDKNESAMSVYRKFGFDQYELDPEAGKAVFWQKKL